MSKTLLLFCCMLPAMYSSPTSWLTPYEKSGKLSTATYEEAIAYYQRLDQTYDEISMSTYGKTDVGKPLHLVVISNEGVFEPAAVRASQKPFLLINNGIHPGEPCGIDACMMLARDLMQDEEMKKLLDKVVIGIIPIYNIGGALNRGCCSRANQEGPTAYGFRGNARNYDLNRDFIKSDTRNAKAFAQIFHTWLPDLFVDTHTTNGADYQAALTYIATQPDKVDKELATYMQEALIPGVVEHVEQAGITICPYVNVFGTTPDKGINGFIDLPRYSSGYAALFQTMSFITEAHMLKTFEQRVHATYVFLEGLIAHAAQNGAKIIETVQHARLQDRRATQFDIAWELDKSAEKMIEFKGYEAKYKPSEVTGQNRLYYDRESPYTKKIPFRNHYTGTSTIQIPHAYLIPQAYEPVIERLKLNKVEMYQLAKDTVLSVEVRYLESVETSRRAYEGHFMHQKVATRAETQQIQYYKGDVVVFLNQIRNRFITHVLEPVAQDSYFRWNFFDASLMQKEYFSPYVFEDEAAQMLKEDESLRKAFEERKAEDERFAKSAYAQLNYLYEQSDHYEKTYNRYPVACLNQQTSLPLQK